MKKIIILILVLAMGLSMAACRKEGTPMLGENSLNIGEAAEIIVYFQGMSSLCNPGTRENIYVHITDEEDIAYITSNINALSTEEGETPENSRGVRYELNWVDADGNSIEKISLNKYESRFIYNRDTGKWLKTDKEMDVDFLAECVRKFGPVRYNGRYYDREGLSEKTLKWAEMTVEERDESKYEPKDLHAHDWGITITVSDVSATGLTLTATQEGEDMPKVGFESFGLETVRYGGWEEVPDIRKNMMDLAIAPPVFKGLKEIPIDLEEMYGALPAGRYRLLMDFCGGYGWQTWQTYAAEFVVE